VWVEKEGGKRRPLGIPALEDKILRRAVQMVLQSIYEIEFHDHSYGFRPGRFSWVAQVISLKIQAPGIWSILNHWQS
jgi:retron-type reverse transcriptase